MAIKPNENETFYREVDEEVRKEQLRSWWSRYGIAAILGIVLLLALIAGALWWQQQKREEAGERGERMVQILRDIEQGETEGLEPRLDALAAEGSPGYRAAALLTKANLAIQADRQADAIAAFKSVAEDAELPEPYRNLALIRQTMLEFDSLPPATVVQRLQPLAQPGSPWFGSAGELTAMAHLKQNQPQRAAPIFAALAKEEGAPESVRARAVQMAGALGIDAVEQAPAADADQGAAKEASQ